MEAEPELEMRRWPLQLCDLIGDDAGGGVAADYDVLRG